MLTTLSALYPLQNSGWLPSPLHTLTTPPTKKPQYTQIVGLVEMAMMLSSAVIPASATTMSRKTKVVHIGQLGPFGGLKAQNKITSLGLPLCTNQQFSMVINSLKSQGKGRGGALTSTCSAVAEIFKIAAIMNGLVLVGVAVGFVLLRIEASLEEAE